MGHHNLALASAELDRQERVLNRPRFEFSLAGQKAQIRWGKPDPSDLDLALLDASAEIYQKAIEAAALDIEIAAQQVFGEFSPSKEDANVLDSNSSFDDRRYDSGGYLSLFDW